MITLTSASRRHARAWSLTILLLLPALWFSLPSRASAEDTPLPGAETARLMNALVSEDPAVVSAALQDIRQGGDPRFIPVLLESVRAIQLRLLPWNGYEQSLAVLTALSGKGFADDFGAWVEWYGATDLMPPAGFTGWKGRLLARLDPRFADFLRDDHPRTIRVEEILWGGVAVDGIPPLDQSAMIPAGEAAYLEPEDLVFGLKVGEDARAYPLKIMDWHEMANDVVGGEPVSLAYCTLCGAAIAYRGRLADGRTTTFGTSGFLFRSNKLMYDRLTHSLWNQMTGEPVLGPLAGKEDAARFRLELLPVVLTTWQAWKARHPHTRVLDIETGYKRPYRAGAAYGRYFASARTLFPVWKRRTILKDKTWIFGMRVEGVPKAYPLEALLEAGVVNDEIAGRRVVLVGEGRPFTVEGSDRRGARVRYANGGEVRAYDAGIHRFEAASRSNGRPVSLVDEQGRSWRIAEEGLLGPEGRVAPRLPGHLAYWFGWYAFFPKTLVHGHATP